MELREINQNDNITRDYNLNEDENAVNVEVTPWKLVADWLQLMNDHVIPTEDKIFKCNVCNKEFTKAEHLNVHKRTHAGEKRQHCGLCNKTFKCKSALIQH